MQDLEQAIRERAYHLWIADGCRDGNADEYWLSAQREFLAGSLDGCAGVKDTQNLSSGTKQTRKVKTTKAKGKQRVA